jgi:hypothetical protein
MGTVEKVTAHPFQGIKEHTCEAIVSAPFLNVACGLPMGWHEDQSLARLAPHAWLGRPSEGGSNTPCSREGCNEPRLAKTHSGFGVEYLEVPAVVEAGELYQDEEEEHEYPTEPTLPVPAVMTFIAHADAVQQLVKRKDAAYGGAWQKNGYIGNLARIKSKTDRLTNMLWKDEQYPIGGTDGRMSEEESVLDTLHDLMALCAFMATNIEDGNRWGS